MPTLIVVGGLSAGPAAAVKARRTDGDCSILLFEKGDNVSYATCGMPYALSGIIESRDKLLVTKPELLEKRFRIEMHLGEAVEDIDPVRKRVRTSQGEYAYDSLVFAAGARSLTPPIAGLDQARNWSSLRTMEDFDRIKTALSDPAARHVTVLGAGLIGVEVAENLIHLGKQVRILEGSPQVLPPWDAEFGHFAADVLRQEGVELHLNSLAEAVDIEPGPGGAADRSGRLLTVRLRDGRTLATDYLILSAGIRPNTELLTGHGAAALGNGALIVDECMQTSLPHIYAAGDCVALPNLLNGKSGYFPLGTHSNKAGRAAGFNAVTAGFADAKDSGDSKRETFRGAFGTAIVQVFGHTLARTGMNEKSLSGGDIPFTCAYIHAGATPGYYPDAKDMGVKICYHRETGKLLGAEIFGEKGVDKRIDVFATCLYAGLTVDDLPQLDLAYAPPYSPAKDPVVVAGYVAQNQLRHGYASLGAQTLSSLLEAPDGRRMQLIDVRTESEVKAQGRIADALNIPLDDLRERLDEIDPARNVVVYCQRGIRGYLSNLILRQKGFAEVANLSGGFLAWSMQGYPVQAP